jgi:hypothetical protein
MEDTKNCVWRAKRALLAPKRSFGFAQAGILLFSVISAPSW